MKTPPFLLLAALLFWGWFADFLWTGAIMGAVLESARFLKFRWDLDDADFNRIWSFCVLLIVVLAAYVFTNNNQSSLGGMLHGNTTAEMARAGALTTTRFWRWLPMTTFAFILAQTFNERPSVPLTAVSIVLRWRRRKGERALAGHYLNISYPFFMVCLLAAGIHVNRPATNDGKIYFIGQVILIAWAMWAVRPRRYGVWAWVAALAMVAGVGGAGVVGIIKGEHALQLYGTQWMQRFFHGGSQNPLESATSMGRIGQMKLSAQIIIRLEPAVVGKVPEYLREASYRVYSSQHLTWHANGGRANKTTDFEAVHPETNNTTWVLVPGKTNTAVVNIACFLDGQSDDGYREGVLPLPSGCSRLENLAADTAVIALQKSPNGTVVASGLGLMIFDARFGPGATLDAPPDLETTNQFDLKVPTNEIPALDRVIAEMNLTTTNDFEKRLAVEKFFRDKFTYSTWQGFDKLADASGTPMTKFLLTSRSGHCEYFASATVLLLRELGIPARYAVGYYVHEARGTGYVVRERDGHAWCLAWNRATRTWEDFDTTPPAWVAVEGRRTEFGEWFTDLRSWLGFQFAKFRWHQANLQQYIIWALVPVMLVLLYHIIFKRRKKRRGAEDEGTAAAVAWPGLDSEFYQLEKLLAARGVPRQASEALSDWLERALAEPALAELRGPLQELLGLHYRHRFDPQGLSAAERERLRREAKACLERLLRAKAG
ncbi:MAG: transglutaminase domain-containing protein [Verrucomicrobiae bacterium]|nr:transglutaminase domain-containing protein [Verrucomicrobiae bacterium]